MLSARNNVKASDLVLTADGEAYQKLNINPTTPDNVMNIDSTLSSYLKNSKVQQANSHILKEVVIKDTKIVKKVSHKDYSNLASLSSEPDHLITGAQLADCNSALECIKSLATGMIFEDQNFYISRDYK